MNSCSAIWATYGVSPIGTVTSMDAAYTRGYFDGFGGKRYRNPYPVGTDAHVAYLAGFYDGRGAAGQRAGVKP